MLLILPLASSFAQAQNVEAVEIRLDTAIQYPNDRPINIIIEGMAFASDKPSRSQVEVTAELRWPNSTLAEVQTVSVSPGIRTSITFDSVKSVGVMYIYATGETNGITSEVQTQRTRITYAPQQYTAGFLEGGRFIVTPLQKHLNLTISEYLDNGNSIVPGRTFFVSGENSSLNVEAPKGYLAVRYSIQDENGWLNYERAEGTGLTVHGTPYVWIYGDLQRIEPFATLLSPISIVFGVIGSVLILAGVFNFWNRFREESLVRRKEAGVDNQPGWGEMRREKKMRQRAEENYWRRNRGYQDFDSHRRRY